MKIIAPPLRSAVLSAELLAAQWQTWMASIGDALRGDSTRTNKTITISGNAVVSVVRSVGGLLFISVKIPAGTTCGGEQIVLPCSVESGTLLITDGNTVIGCLAVSGSALSLPGQTWTNDGFITGTLAQQES